MGTPGPKKPKKPKEQKMTDTIEYKGHTINIRQDVYPDNPRDWNKLGTMACWHRRYNLGDEQPRRQDPNEYKLDLVDSSIAERYEHLEYVGEYEKSLELLFKSWDKDFIALDLFLYDHSGISISTGNFSCTWDSGQIGFIYISKADAKKEFGWQRLTKARTKKIESYLRSEVKIYDQYLRGDVWYMEIPQLEESCSGFFGYDYAIEEAKQIIDNETRRMTS